MLLTQLDAPGPLDLVDRYAAAGPLVRGGMVLSADGAAAHGGASAPLSVPADRAVFRALRAACDVVLVGAGTARAEDYRAPVLRDELVAWRAARGLPPRPRLAVVTRSGDLEPSARLFAGPAPLVLAPRPAYGRLTAALGSRADVVLAGEEEVDLAAALAALRDRGLAHVLCEGGPGLLGDLVRAGLLDELCCTVSPLLAGAAPGLLAGALPEPVPLRLVHALACDGALLLRWSLREAGQG